MGRSTSCSCGAASTAPARSCAATRTCTRPPRRRSPAGPALRGPQEGADAATPARAGCRLHQQKRAVKRNQHAQLIEERSRERARVVALEQENATVRAELQRLQAIVAQFA